MADEGEWIDVSLAQDGGVQKKILKEAPEGASGPPPEGNEVEAHYTGTFHVACCLFLPSTRIVQYSSFSLFLQIQVHWARMAPSLIRVVIVASRSSLQSARVW
jgi:hypothetical protein